jgi:CubicO group peptidase (beta-lactamase class C family)
MTRSPNKLFKQASKQIQSEMRKLSIPGVALGIYYKGKEYTAGFGITNTENPQPYNENTLGQVGSISKTVTATAAMQLVEAGKLDLDTPVKQYLPDLRLADDDVAAHVTMRHLFSHTAGWLGDYFDDTGRGDDALEKIVSRMEKLPQITPLGEVWSYNNAGFYLAARVLEVIAGKPVEALVRELVLEPLGMDHSFFFADEAITYRAAVGHEAVFGKRRTPKVLRPWPIARSGNAIGGLNSTILDLLRYARFHMGSGKSEKGKQVLKPENLKLMQTPIHDAANDEQIGISWFLKDVGGVRILRHGGATNGQMAVLVIVPEKQFAFTMLTNSDRGSDLYGPLMNWALKAYLGLDMPEPQPLRAKRKELKQYTGTYSAAADDFKLKLRGRSMVLIDIPKGGFPTVDSPPGPAAPTRKVDLYRPDGLIVLDPPGKGNLGEFLRGPDGEIKYLRIGGRLHTRK